MKVQRFHFLHALHYVRYGLVLCLVPVARALLTFDLAALPDALRQDLVILIACAGAAAALWLATRFSVGEDFVSTRQGVLILVRRRYSAKSISAVEIRRPLYCRALGASYLTLYFKTRSARRKVVLCLPRRAAEQAAQTLLPVRSDTSVFAPMGFERLAFVMLSANVVTSCAFLWIGARRVTEWLGSGVRDKALENFAKFETLLETVLPAGLAFAAAALFVAVSFTFLHALMHTAGFRVCRNGGVIVSRGGLITKVELRILVSAVTSADVRVTPVARLLRRRPVYVTAGSYRGGELPLMVFRAGSDRAPQALLPGYSPPDGPLCTRTRKSLVQYLWKPGAALAVSLSLCGVAMWALPGALPVLYVPAAAALACCAQSAEGYFTEGARRNQNRTISVVYTRFFTRHEVCVLTQDVVCEMFRHPVAVNRGRCDFTVRMPCGVRCRARGILFCEADRIPVVY